MKSAGEIKHCGNSTNENSSALQTPALSSWSLGNMTSEQGLFWESVENYPGTRFRAWFLGSKVAFLKGSWFGAKF